MKASKLYRFRVDSDSIELIQKKKKNSKLIIAVIKRE